MDGVQVVAAADPSKKALAKAKKIGIQSLYTEYQDLIDKSKHDMDAVIISVPNFLHFDTIRLSLENGLNVFAEKPLAVNVRQSEDIVNLVHSSGRKFMIGHSMRFVPAVEKIKADLKKGVIGNLEVATIEEVMNGPFSHPRVPAPVADWWFDPARSGGGALIDIGYHMIDLFRFLTEEDASVIFSDLSYKYDLLVEEGARLVLSTNKNSVKGIINVGWYMRSVFPKFNFRAILHGDCGYLSTDEYTPKNIYTHAAKEGAKNILKRVAGRKPSYLSYTYYWESYYKEMTSFIQSIAKDTETSASAEEGLKTMQIIEQAYKMAKKPESENQ
jgi:myo-inositol 2-dehydrogenase / D-chiro-inositol 1-dehydrogenase